MKKLATILKESYETYQYTVLLKNYKSINKSEIINKIRAVPYIIRVKVVEDPRLEQINKKYDYEYTFLKIKYLNVFATPQKATKVIKHIVLNGQKGFHKIDGVIAFKSINNSLHKVV